MKDQSGWVACDVSLYIPANATESISKIAVQGRNDQRWIQLVAACAFIRVKLCRISPFAIPHRVLLPEDVRDGMADATTTQSEQWIFRFIYRCYTLHWYDRPIR